MKFLHTSDWHLGVTMHGAPCEEEQRRFLDWLIETIEEEEVDVLLVAGDIFHRDQPPARALKLYYRFLARCAQTALSQVVVVGGNHDSQTRLDAPAEALQALRVHVVGGLRADEESWEQCLCPVASPHAAEIENVVVAVPYVQEAKLGILTTSADSTEIRRQYTEGFTHLYKKLAELANERYPGATLIATGHLTCESESGKIERGDFHEEIHQVGTINGLPPSIFDERYEYVALGHIHRMFPIKDSRAWYCGTPVSTSQNETGQRFVLCVDTDKRDDDGELIVEKLRVPTYRIVEALRGSQEEITEAILNLPRQAELVPYLFIDVEIKSVDEMYEMRQYFDDLIKENFAEGFRPRIIERREHLAKAAVEGDKTEGLAQVPTLDEMTPEDVFRRLFSDKHEGHLPSEEYLLAFRYLSQTRSSRDYDAEDAPMLRVDDDDEEYTVEEEQEEKDQGEDASKEPAMAGETS